MPSINRMTFCLNDLKLLLKDRYHAKGDDLLSLINSCEERLPHDVLTDLKSLVEIHANSIAIGHVSLSERRIFMANYHQSKRTLTPRSNLLLWRLVFALILFSTVMALVFYIALYTIYLF